MQKIKTARGVTLNILICQCYCSTDLKNCKDVFPINRKFMQQKKPPTPPHNVSVFYFQSRPTK